MPTRPLPRKRPLDDRLHHMDGEPVISSGRTSVIEFEERSSYSVSRFSASSPEATFTDSRLCVHKWDLRSFSGIVQTLKSHAGALLY